MKRSISPVGTDASLTNSPSRCDQDEVNILVGTQAEEKRQNVTPPTSGLKKPPELGSPESTRQCRGGKKSREDAAAVPPAQDGVIVSIMQVREVENSNGNSLPSSTILSGKLSDAEWGQKDQVSPLGSKQPTPTFTATTSEPKDTSPGVTTPIRSSDSQTHFPVPPTASFPTRQNESPSVFPFPRSRSRSEQATPSGQIADLTVNTSRRGSLGMLVADESVGSDISALLEEDIGEHFADGTPIVTSGSRPLSLTVSPRANARRHNSTPQLMRGSGRRRGSGEFSPLPHPPPVGSSTNRSPPSTSRLPQLTVDTTRRGDQRRGGSTAFRVTPAALNSVRGLLAHEEPENNTPSASSQPPPNNQE